MNRKPRFFIDKLTPAGVKDEGFALYDFEGERLRWSAPFPLPAIGTRIYITMNSIGWATVEGFFAEDGYLGVMTKAENPPQWLLEQRQRAATRYTPETPEWLKRGIGCEFGAEIALKQPTAAPRPIKTA
jgi:hypothetical protein